MNGRRDPRAFARGSILALLLVLFGAATTCAQGRLTGYGLRMDPAGQDARTYSRANSVGIQPGYFQYYLGIGVSFEVFKQGM